MEIQLNTKHVQLQETYAAVARVGTLGILFALANTVKYQMDVKTAFLNGFLNEKIYMRQLQDIEYGDNLVDKLNNSQYGLKQATRV